MVVLHSHLQVGQGHPLRVHAKYVQETMQTMWKGSQRSNPQRQAS